MVNAVWFALGLLLGLALMVGVTRLLIRRVELRARQAERRARKSERLAELGAMTGGLAHEIKNPLSTIGLNAQLLTEAINDADMPEEQRGRLLKRLGALAREVERLRGILTDFLQFAGRIKLDPHQHNLVALIEELSDFFHPQCDQAGVRLRAELPSTPILAEVDEGYFKQALLNLMINAVQAMTDDGAVSKRGAAAAPQSRGELILRVDADADEARVHVIDTGPGISADKLETIFHPYVSMRSGGTGLGLPTARRIAEEHGGRLEAHSEPGRGSNFVIHLPRKASRHG